MHTKTEYETPSYEILMLEVSDVICKSYELPPIPFHDDPWAGADAQ